MTILPLYTGGGISLSPENGPGRVLSRYVRAIADDGKMLSKDDVIAYCVDILPEEVPDWAEIDEQEPGPEAELADYEEQLKRVGVLL